MTASESPATHWSLAFLLGLVERGVRHVVVSPGSRSQALALAAYELSRHPDVSLSVHVSVDERTAGFFGLGLSIHTGQPAVLICTSGSAPAHYLPALLEAKHSGIPLIALTADRPPELQGVGANQTTVQPGMFGPAVHGVLQVNAPEGQESDQAEALERATEAARLAHQGAPGGRPGPVQVNIAFREPLSSPLSTQHIDDVLSALRDASPDVTAATNVAGSNTAIPPIRELTLEPQPGTIVIAGHRAGAQAEQLAIDLGAPLIAEVHSGAHFGPHLVVAYRELLDNPPQGVAIERVVCVGRPTLSRQVQASLARTDVEQVVWQRTEPEPANPSGAARIADHIVVANPASRDVARSWVGPWVHASRQLVEAQSEALDPPAPDVALLDSDDMAERSRFAKAEMDVVRRPLTRRQIALEVWQNTWPHDQLVLGSSRMIRECDMAVPGKNISVWSSRGLSGIDGTIATARGIAMARARSGDPATAGITRVVLGDLAFLHDAGSLLLDQGEAEDTRVQVIVVRDGGGSLFDLLEASRTAEVEAFNRVIFTPADAKIEALAGAYGWSYVMAKNHGDLVEALANPAQHLVVDCLVPRREDH